MYEAVMARREALYQDHPLVADTEILDTPLLRGCLSQVKPLVLLRATGFWVSATSGQGKTSLLDYLQRQLPECGRGIVVLRYNATTDHPLAMRGFHQRMARCVGNPVITGEIGLLKDRVMNAFGDIARSRACSILVLLVDEAQQMTREQLYFLKDVVNEIRQSGLRLVVGLAGQEPQMSDWLQKLNGADNLCLRNRFGCRPLPFPKYVSVEDYEGFLGAIDEAVYPTNSSVTWTQFFFPELWREGFRLKSQAKPLVDVLDLIRGPTGQGACPIREVTAAIR
jgi:hypothetical protein